MVISIRNSNKTYAIELSETESLSVFKQRIEDATSIPVARQKILCKLPPGLDDLSPCAAVLAKIKQPIAVLGSPVSAEPVAPIRKQIFSEDLSPDQRAGSLKVPLGLLNLGNTCYLNATLQALFAVKDVKDVILKNTPTKGEHVAGLGGGSNGVLICNSLKTVFSQMNLRTSLVSPALFLTVFRNEFPQFAERSPHGGFKQQDAEEAFTQIMSLISRHYNLSESFRIEFHSLQKCLANETEPVQESTEGGFKLNCHIDIKTNFLRDGIISGLTGELEKYLETVGANATYKITRSITRLPKFLVVQFVRFFWKRETLKKSKILRRVQFPFELDVADMLHDSIKAEKTKARDAIRVVEKDLEDNFRDYKKRQKLEPNTSPVEQQELHDATVASMRAKFRSDLKQALPQVSDLETATENALLVYELCLVITHAGALADSGHYQAYVKDDLDLEGINWWRFNDDKVSSVLRDRIEQLAGGGESDSALILVYKAKGM